MIRHYKVVKKILRKNVLIRNNNTFVSSLSSFSSSISSLLHTDYRSIVSEERIVLGKLHAALKLCNATTEDLDLISDTRASIDDLFMLVIVGEFNAGKSTFINALLGEKYCKEGKNFI